MAKVGLVVDSTADLEPSFYVENDVKLVPLTVRFGDEAALDWVEMRPDRFYEKLRDTSELPKTSQPSVSQFAEAYETLSGECDSIISMHLSSGLSGTVHSADIASRDAPVPVTVIDTKLASVGIGLALDEALRARADGATHEELVETIKRRSASIRTLFYVDTLKYLQMGGRIGKAQALAGALLRIRPILQLGADGIVAPFKKVKGVERVYDDLVDAVAQDADSGTAKVGLVHATNPEALVRIKQLLEERRVRYDAVFESSIGSVIGTYIGPGAFGVIYYVEPGAA